MAEGNLYRASQPSTVKFTAGADYSAGEVLELPDGRAGIIAGLAAIASGSPAVAEVTGQFIIAKTAGVVILPGGRVYWDRSVNAATPLSTVAGADFYVGVAPYGATSAATTVIVDLNVRPSYLIDLHRDPFDTTVVLTAGTPFCYTRGGAACLGFSATAEAQKLDLLSVRSVPISIPMIVECTFEVSVVADADVADLNLGLANDTHASDADSIAESLFFHQDSGADLNLDAESDDGTTEVAATDTTIDIVAGTPIEVWWDARVLSACKAYVNGVQVLSGTTFDISAVTGPLKLLAHWEKSANDSPGEVRISHLALRTTDFASISN